MQKCDWASLWVYMCVQEKEQERISTYWFSIMCQTLNYKENVFFKNGDSDSYNKHKTDTALHP